MTNKRAVLLGIAAPLVLALILVFVGPAAAHHRVGHAHGHGNAKGQSHRPSAPVVTEDNDTNDNGTPGGVVDDGDNAHPSGKDKSVEHGNSGNQGNSPADPDDDGHGPDRSNGGADKPDGPGGVDLADQDGNNGCGNDDDFEDDNEGWCGKNPKAKAHDERNGRPDTDENAPVGDVGEAVDDDATGCPEDSSMVGSVCGMISDAVTDADVARPDQVLGERIERPATGLPATALTSSGPPTTPADTAERAASTLPFTGTGAAKLLIVAAALILLGLLMLKARRRA